MFICLQKNNFITHFFLKILQRNNKIVTLGNIGMSGRLHTPKMIVSIWRNLTFIYSQQISFNFHVFLGMLQRYCKLAILGTLGMPGYPHPKWYHRHVKNFRVYLQAKNQLHLSRFSGDIERYANLFGYFGHVWLRTPKMLVSTCRKLRCLSAYQKNFTGHFFLEILHFKEPCNLIGQHHFGP